MIHRIKFASLFAVLIALFGTICAPLTASAACTAATIARIYGFRFNGFIGPVQQVPLKISAFYPEAVAGEISFTPTSVSEEPLAVPRRQTLAVWYSHSHSQERTPSTHPDAPVA